MEGFQEYYRRDRMANMDLSRTNAAEIKKCQGQFNLAQITMGKSKDLLA